MVDDHRQHVHVRSKPEHEDPEDGAFSEHELPIRELEQQRGHSLLRVAVRLGLEIEELEHLLARCMHDLERLAVVLKKGRAQGLVPVKETLERTFESVEVELARQSQDDGYVVRGASAIETIEEPEPLLGMGKREPVAVVRADGFSFHRRHGVRGRSALSAAAARPTRCCARSRRLSTGPETSGPPTARA